MTSPQARSGHAPAPPSAHRVVSDNGASLVDLLDRVVQRGVVVNGDLIISLAGVDLIRLDLRLLLSGVSGALAGTSGRPVEEA